MKYVTIFKLIVYLYLTINNNTMTTIDSKDLKMTLKNMGVKVLRTLTYKNGVIVTVNAESVSICEEYFASKNIMCVRPMNAPVKAKANVLGYAGAAEFTSLYQL